MSDNKISDGELISNWRALLDVFDKIEPSDPKAKEKWVKLSETSNVTQLTPRQRAGIVARCNYAIKGEYKHEARTAKTD